MTKTFSRAENPPPGHSAPAVVGWATDVTYQTAPRQSDRLRAPDGAVLMTAQDMADGKASCQRADLMDYGSFYGMETYFGEGYTAEYRLRLGRVTHDNITRACFGRPFAALGAEDQARRPRRDAAAAEKHRFDRR